MSQLGYPVTVSRQTSPFDSRKYQVLRPMGLLSLGTLQPHSQFPSSHPTAWCSPAHFSHMLSLSLLKWKARTLEPYFLCWCWTFLFNPFYVPLPNLVQIASHHRGKEVSNFKFPVCCLVMLQVPQEYTHENNVCTVSWQGRAGLDFLHSAWFFLPLESLPLFYLAYREAGPQFHEHISYYYY